MSDAITIGKSGAFTIPAGLIKQFGLTEGSMLIAESTAEGILLRPATGTAVELYSNERTAELLLSNAIDVADYELARKEVIALGLDPDKIKHQKPA